MHASTSAYPTDVCTLTAVDFAASSHCLSIEQTALFATAIAPISELVSCAASRVVQAALFGMWPGCTCQVLSAVQFLKVM